MSFEPTRAQPPATRATTVSVAFGTVLTRWWIQRKYWAFLVWCCDYRSE